MGFVCSIVYVRARSYSSNNKPKNKLKSNQICGRYSYHGESRRRFLEVFTLSCLYILLSLCVFIVLSPPSSSFFFLLCLFMGFDHLFVFIYFQFFVKCVSNVCFFIISFQHTSRAHFVSFSFVACAFEDNFQYKCHASAIKQSFNNGRGFFS